MAHLRAAIAELKEAEKELLKSKEQRDRNYAHKVYVFSEEVLEFLELVRCHEVGWDHEKEYPDGHAKRWKDEVK